MLTPRVHTSQAKEFEWIGKIEVWSLGMIGLEILWCLPQRPQHKGNRLGLEPNNPYYEFGFPIEKLPTSSSGDIQNSFLCEHK